MHASFSSVVTTPAALNTPLKPPSEDESLLIERGQFCTYAIHSLYIISYLNNSEFEWFWKEMYVY